MCLDEPIMTISQVWARVKDEKSFDDASPFVLGTLAHSVRGINQEPPKDALFQ
jgi:hypothetical protein